jgi:hypothetical protein
LKDNPARLAMMIFGGSPIRGRGAADIAGHRLGEEEGDGGERHTLAEQERDRSDEQDGRDIVKQGGGDRRDEHEQHHHPERSAPRALRRPDRQELENSCLTQDSDEDHHPEQQEDDIPVDAGLGREVDLVPAGSRR